MGRVTKFPTSRCPTGTQGEATSLPLMSSLSRTNTTSDLLKRRKKRRSRILTRTACLLEKKKGNIREGLPAAKIQCIVTGSLPEERNKACPRLANQTIHSMRS
ncbi:uncharacterized protein [Dermacentor andersoni]|uniref:uncharacterized protein isoform X2 n=1 Tax=Dermacentor andersoni TaxID=34620 RepID=UPI00241762D7|nr:uncharacterized protein LOC129380471 isoform X2 [Dermacentor andersoni]